MKMQLEKEQARLISTAINIVPQEMEEGQGQRSQEMLTQDVDEMSVQGQRSLGAIPEGQRSDLSPSNVTTDWQSGNMIGHCVIKKMSSPPPHIFPYTSGRTPPKSAVFSAPAPYTSTPPPYTSGTTPYTGAPSPYTTQQMDVISPSSVPNPAQMTSNSRHIDSHAGYRHSDLPTDVPLMPNTSTPKSTVHGYLTADLRKPIDSMPKTQMSQTQITPSQIHQSQKQMLESQRSHGHMSHDVGSPSQIYPVQPHTPDPPILTYMGKAPEPSKNYMYNQPLPSGGGNTLTDSGRTGQTGSLTLNSGGINSTDRFTLNSQRHSTGSEETNGILSTASQAVPSGNQDIFTRSQQNIHHIENTFNIPTPQSDNVMHGTLILPDGQVFKVPLPQGIKLNMPQSQRTSGTAQTMPSMSSQNMPPSSHNCPMDIGFARPAQTLSSQTMAFPNQQMLRSQFMPSLPQGISIDNQQSLQTSQHVSQDRLPMPPNVSYPSHQHINITADQAASSSTGGDQISVPGPGNQSSAQGSPQDLISHGKSGNSIAVTSSQCSGNHGNIQTGVMTSSKDSNRPSNSNTGVMVSYQPDYEQDSLQRLIQLDLEFGTPPKLPTIKTDSDQEFENSVGNSAGNSAGNLRPKVEKEPTSNIPPDRVNREKSNQKSNNNVSNQAEKFVQKLKSVISGPQRVAGLQGNLTMSEKTQNETALGSQHTRATVEPGLGNTSDSNNHSKNLPEPQSALDMPSPDVHSESSKKKDTLMDSTKTKTVKDGPSSPVKGPVSGKMLPKVGCGRPRKVPHRKKNRDTASLIPPSSCDSEQTLDDEQAQLELRFSRLVQKETLIHGEKASFQPQLSEVSASPKAASPAATSPKASGISADVGSVTQARNVSESTRPKMDNTKEVTSTKAIHNSEGFIPCEGHVTCDPTASERAKTSEGHKTETVSPSVQGTESETLVIRCQNCLQEFGNLEECSHHMSSIHYPSPKPKEKSEAQKQPKKWRCSTCCTFYPDPGTLAKHLREKHPSVLLNKMELNTEIVKKLQAEINANKESNKEGEEMKKSTEDKGETEMESRETEEMTIGSEIKTSNDTEEKNNTTKEPNKELTEEKGGSEKSNEMAKRSETETSKEASKKKKGTKEVEEGGDKSHYHQQGSNPDSVKENDIARAGNYMTATGDELDTGSKVEEDVSPATNIETKDPERAKNNRENVTMETNREAENKSKSVAMETGYLDGHDGNSTDSNDNVSMETETIELRDAPGSHLKRNETDPESSGKSGDKLGQKLGDKLEQKESVPAQVNTIKWSSDLLSVDKARVFSSYVKLYPLESQLQVVGTTSESQGGRSEQTGQSESEAHTDKIGALPNEGEKHGRGRSLESLGGQSKQAGQSEHGDLSENKTIGGKNQTHKSDVEAYPSERQKRGRGRPRKQPGVSETKDSTNSQTSETQGSEGTLMAATPDYDAQSSQSEAQASGGEEIGGGELKRGRGRPRKQPIVSVTDCSNSSQITETQSSKDTFEASADFDTQSETQAPAREEISGEGGEGMDGEGLKRGRGRPRKEPSICKTENPESSMNSETHASTDSLTRIKVGPTDLDTDSSHSPLVNQSKGSGRLCKSPPVSPIESCDNSKTIDTIGSTDAFITPTDTMEISTPSETDSGDSPVVNESSVHEKRGRGRPRKQSDFSMTTGCQASVTQATVVTSVTSSRTNSHGRQSRSVTLHWKLCFLSFLSTIIFFVFYHL